MGRVITIVGIFALSLFGIRTEAITIQSIPCACTWTNGKESEFSEYAVSTGSADFVACPPNDPCVPGRLSPLNETAFIPDLGSYSDFRVLTNAGSCVIEWVGPDEFEAYKHLAVQINGMYVGRAIFEGNILGGKVSVSDPTKISVVNMEGTTVTYNDPEILVSTYPLMTCALTDFSFEMNFDALEEKSKIQLFGVEEVKNRANVVVQQSFTHTQNFEEYFQLTEDSLSWIGMNSVDQSMLMWFGSPILKQVFDVTDGTNIELITRRERELTVSKQITMTNQTEVQVCSYAVVADGFPIKYTAQASCTASPLTGHQVGQVIKATGRDFKTSSGDKATTEVKGEVIGKFVIRVNSEVLDATEELSCMKIINEPIFLF